MTAVTASETRKPSRLAKWGWGILLTISALLILNGVTWYFMGPDSSLSYLERGAGVPIEEFGQSYPVAVDHIAKTNRQVAVWFTAFGLMAFMVALEGFRHASRWAWNTTWVIVILPLAIGMVYMGRELAFVNVGFIAVAGVALVGQLLARQKMAPAG